MRRRVVFVCRSTAGESLRSAQALRNLERVELFGIVEDSSGADVFVDAQQVANVHDADQLIAAARKFGPLDHIVTAQETLLEPVAKTREALDIPEVMACRGAGAVSSSTGESACREDGLDLRESTTS